MANKGKKSEQIVSSSNNKNGVFFKPSSIQGIIKYVIAGLGLLLLFSLFINIVKVTGKDITSTFQGYSIAFGQGYETPIQDISLIKNSVALIITYILVIGASFTVLTDFENKEWLKRLILPVAFLFTAICFLQIPNNFVNASGTAVDVSFTTFGIVFAVIAWLQFALSIALVVIDRVQEGSAKDESQVDIIKYIVAGCSLVALLSLFFGTAKISSSTLSQSFTGSQLAFGTSLDEAILSISTLKSSGIMIAAYIAIVVATILNFIKLPKFDDKKQWFIILLLMFVSFYFWKMPDYLFTGASSKAFKSLTAYGNLSAIACTASLIFSVGILSIQTSKIDTLKYLIAALGIFAVMTLFLPVAGAKMVYNEYVGSKEELSGYKLIFTSATCLSGKTTPIYLLLSYIAAVLGSIALLIDIKPKKIRYLVSCALLLAAIILFVFVPTQTFAITKNSDYYFGYFSNTGIVVMVILAISCIGDLYLTSVTPVEE